MSLIDATDVPPFGGSGDEYAGVLSMADRFRFHAASLERSRRSPLCRAILEGAADDIERRGVVADLFDGVPTPPGSVPTLRLLAALHYAVLSGRAAALADFYPSAGGTKPPRDVWLVVRETLHQNYDTLKEEIGRPVQTNEVGRGSVLFIALLWLAVQYDRPIRLLEIGASAGLNLFVDRFCYVINGLEIGRKASSVRFVEPVRQGFGVDVEEAGRRLHLIERRGCDVSPLDVQDAKDRVRLLSYIWPDEEDRLMRAKAAIAVAASDPPIIERRKATSWLTEALNEPVSGVLTVVWQSLVRQYLTSEERRQLDEATGVKDKENAPTVWLSMEHVRNVNRSGPGIELTLRTADIGTEIRLATCGNHGAPIFWHEDRETW